jgi:hypothetical protein
METSLDSSKPQERYDIIFLYGESDGDNATKLRNILHRFVRLSGDRKLTFYPEEYLGRDQFDWLDHGLNHSHLKFLLFNHGTEDDTWAIFQVHNALQAMIRRRDRSIVPVKLHRNVRVPRLLEMYPKVDVCKLLNGRPLELIHNVDDLLDVNIDYDVRTKIAKAVDHSVGSQSRQHVAADKEGKLDTEESNFVHLSLIITNVGTHCVRQIFDKHVKDLKKWLQKMQSKVKPLVFESAMENVYPKDPKKNPPNSANFDLTLLFALLLKGLIVGLDKDLIGILEKLRDKRNGYAHRTSSRISTDEYNKEIQELREILIDQLPKHGCDIPDRKHFDRRPTSLSDVKVTIDGKIIWEQIANVQSNMLGLANEVRDIRELIERLYGRNDVFKEVSEQDKEASAGQVHVAVADATAGKDAVEERKMKEETDVDEWIQNFGSMELHTPEPEQRHAIDESVPSQ